MAINLGVTAGSATLPNTYSVTPIVGHGDAQVVANNLAAANGLAAVTATSPGTQVLQTAATGGMANNMALSIQDFNIFRIRVIDAINVLDAKIREMTALTTLTC